jgi:6,7-dimethyl-8-ribityllumazine synthase
MEGFRAHDLAEPDVDTYDVPGAFELPLGAKACAESGRYAGVACLGAVIRGETDHYDYVCEAATYGISRVQLDTGVPCAFGVLTVDDMDQALARTGGGKRDSGYNAAVATVQMARLVASLRPAR